MSGETPNDDEIVEVDAQVKDVLHRVKIMNTMIVSDDSALSLRYARDYAADRLRLALIAYLAAGKQHEQPGYETIDVPATWWQHFKDDHFPGWLKRWFPVEYVCHHTTRYITRVCPHVPAPRLDQHYAYLFGKDES